MGMTEGSMMFETRAGGVAHAQGEFAMDTSMQSAAQMGSEVIVAKEAAPELTTEQSEQLQKVLSNQRVELVLHNGSESQDQSGAVASVKLKETIQFKGVH